MRSAPSTAAPLSLRGESTALSLRGVFSALAALRTGAESVDALLRSYTSGSWAAMRSRSWRTLRWGPGPSQRVSI